jgi:hypothetical protein
MDPLRSARLPGDPFAGGLRARLTIAGAAILVICALAAFGLS